MRRPAWLTRWSSDVSTQTGVVSAAWSVPGTLGRGLLPRSPIDQAAATGLVIAVNFQVATTLFAAIQAVAAGRPGGRASYSRTMAVSGAALAAGAAGVYLTRERIGDSVAAGSAYAASFRLANAAITGSLACTWDHVLHERLGLRPGLDTTLVPNIATGAALATGIVMRRQARARRYGVVDPERRTISGAGIPATAKAIGVGVGTAVGLTALTVGEQAVVRQVERAVGGASGRGGAAAALLGHALVLGGLGLAVSAGVRQVTQRIKVADDVVEPAYPLPPTSPHVTAGPRSSIPFDSIGKEGRRFVLMALTPEQISAVMGEPAIAPVRVVGGFEAGNSVEERAELTLADLEATGGFERSTIMIGSPTGVGYLNYTLTEALELLARGDCATVVPQYALVPSALALTRTHDGVLLTRLVLEGIAERIRELPQDRRPRVVLFGESLGANVALDLSVDDHPERPGIPEFDRLGVAAGLYFGVPFRSTLWKRWVADPESVDPAGRIVLVAEPDEVPPHERTGNRHLLVVHHDDPVNKFAYSMAVRRPPWLGPPETRPPMVPRETAYRPITSFVIALVDLKNGMQSKPGTFVRRGHDYRIECRASLEAAFGFTATVEQQEAIEADLRRREQEWAARRMVARTMDRARKSIEATLHKWGDPTVDVADLDPNAPLSGVGSRFGSVPSL